ncbi:hypothetical protein GCM10027176_12720 [Actinoallomurus bryophytorum]|uniref:Protein kinase domain-containing protein n=1 Tax=Actinoallomurus bryophytorum TaxID=1490222 RepID=A0A543BTG8_9ACTN|nr:protein kinase family protein [Actinoallomurus bryophytorum]TQL88121.1 hypothetical protein FB559_8738 [Actinoallomurus bryophytorum]
MSGHAARLAAYTAVGRRLARLSDRRLGRAVAAAAPLGSGIGGRSAELDVAGRRVFVKRIPLTGVELDNARSTANLFGLPMFYHYGVGSAGFGAWRELAVHTMTTGWVLGDAYPGFPLMYHWRVLPDSPPEGFAEEFGGIGGAVAYWEGSTAVRERLEAIGRSSSSLVLFLEHLPQTLAAWLDGHEHAAPRVERALARGATFMRSRGLVHFDAHFGNVLTDGRRLYFADFGLALSDAFELSAREAGFLSAHLTYDRRLTASQLLRHLLARTEPEVSLREWTAGGRPGGLRSEIAAIIDRHARPTLVLDGFHRRLLTESRRTPFPAAEIEAATD